MVSHESSAASQSVSEKPGVTPFRQAELYWKSRVSPPDVAAAFSSDAVLWSDETAEWVPPIASPSRPQKIRRVMCNSGREAVTFESFPGLVYLPAYLVPRVQRDLVRMALQEAAVAPNATSLDPHFELPADGIWRASRRERCAVRKKSETALAPTASDQENVQANEKACEKTEPATKVLSRLRWATVGYIYDWTRKIYLFDRAAPPVPRILADVCRQVVQDVPWPKVYGEAGEWDRWHEDYRAEAGLINFYHPGDALTGHIDQAETDATSPLVSISLGLPAVFLIGGKTKNVPPLALLLKSGDVVVMSGPSRSAFHGVPRVLDAPVPEALFSTVEQPSWDEDGFEQYMRSARINCNVRQVHP